MIQRRLLPGMVAGLLAATAGTNLAYFMSGSPSLPFLAISFFPVAAVGLSILVAFLAVQFETPHFQSLTHAQGKHGMVLLYLLIALAPASLIGLATAVTVAKFGAILAFMSLVALVGLGVLFWLSLYRIVDALALYFALWPALIVVRLTILWEKDPGIHQSIFVVPMHIRSERLGGSAGVIAESLWGQFALLSPEALFVAVMFAGWWLSGRRRVPGRGLPSLVHVAIAIILGAGVVSALLSPLPGFSFVWFIGQMGAGVLLFYLVASSVRTESELHRVLWGMLMGLGIISGYHLFSKYQGLAAANMGFGLSTIELASRYNPVLGNPNTAGAVVVYLLAAPLAIMARGRKINPGGLVATVVLAVGLLSLILSASRGPLLALFLMLAVLFWVMARWRVPIVLALAVLILATVPSFDQVTRAALQLRPSLATPVAEDLSIVGRLFLWERSLDVMSERPLFGIGPGLFITLDIFHPRATSFVYEHAHQAFLNLGVEIGLIGLGAFVAVVVIVARSCRRAIRSASSSSHRSALLMIALGLLGFLVVETTTGVPVNDRSGLATGLIPWALAGMVMGARSYLEPRREPNVQGRTRP